MTIAERAELARIEPLLPMDLGDAQAVMAAYQQTCAAVLVETDYQQAGDKRFVKRSGFQKLAAAYGVSTQIVSQDVDRDSDGIALRAVVVVRAVHPAGRFAEGDGSCARSEPRFRSTKARDKLDHDLTATATTRAKNRAVADLIAFGAVSAEEVDATGDQPALAAWALADRETAQHAAEALAYILRRAGVRDETAVVARLGAELRDASGGIPVVCADLLVSTAADILADQIDYGTDSDPKTPADPPSAPPDATPGETTTDLPADPKES